MDPAAATEHDYGYPEANIMARDAAVLLRTRYFKPA
jgi:hypothetical protein